MKRVLIVAVGLSLVGWLTPSNALAAKAEGKKAKLIAKYDKNKNGVIDGDEKEALRKDFAADAKGELKTYDKNKDGKLSDEEIAAIKPGSGKQKVATEAKKGKKSASAESEKKDSEKANPEKKEAAKE